MAHELEVTFLSWINFRNQQRVGPTRTSLREPMGEHITNSQSQRRCHCYGPVRTPASWCLGGRHREDCGGAVCGAAPRPAVLVAGLASSPHLLRHGPHRRARVRVGAAAAFGPGPSRSLLYRRRLRRAARCSRRARPRRIPPLTGTSPLSPQLTRKVRPSPRRAPHLGGCRAGRGGVFLVLKEVVVRVGTGSKPTGDSSPLRPRGPSKRTRVAEGGV